MLVMHGNDDDDVDGDDVEDDDVEGDYVDVGVVVDDDDDDDDKFVAPLGCHAQGRGGTGTRPPAATTCCVCVML